MQRYHDAEPRLDSDQHDGPRASAIMLIWHAFSAKRGAQSQDALDISMVTSLLTFVQHEIDGHVGCLPRGCNSRQGPLSAILMYFLQEGDAHLDCSCELKVRLMSCSDRSRLAGPEGVLECKGGGY